MEACLSAHFVSRTLRALGHEPRCRGSPLPQPFASRVALEDQNELPSRSKKSGSTVG
jgi:hypothetical protein